MIFDTLRRRGAPLSLCLLGVFVVILFPANVVRAEEPSVAPLSQSAPLVDASQDAMNQALQKLAEQLQESDSPSSSPKTSAKAPAKASSAAEPFLDTKEIQQQATKLAKDLENNPAPGPANKPQGLPTGADKTGVSSQSISVPQGAGKIQGMGESFSAQLSTGIATFSIPFALPPARGAAQPSLGLSYSSSAGHGVAGLGWEIGVPFIARQTDRGLPGYDDQADWHPNQDHFVFNGGQELVPICTVSGSACDGALEGEAMPSWADGWQYFRARVEGSFLRFFWSPDHRTWRVQDKSGTHMELGVPCDLSGSTNALETDPSGTRIFRWNLVRQYDLEGDPIGSCEAGNFPSNTVAYRYRKDGGMAYVSDIYSTSPAANAKKAPLSAYAHHTRLVYEQRTDPTLSFRRGWSVTSGLRLKRVDVSSKPFTGGLSNPRGLIRRYHLTYDGGYHASLLISVQVEGRCHETNSADDDSQNPVVEDASEVLPEATGCPTLPAMKMDYQHVDARKSDGTPGLEKWLGYEGFDERVTSMKGSPDHSVDEELSDLFDVNSDGLPDVLVTAPGLYKGNHGLFLNGGNSETGQFWPSCGMPVLGVLGADASVISLKNANVSALDLDADGHTDLLHMPKVKTYSVYGAVPQGTCGKVGGWAWKGRTVTTAGAQAPTIDFGKDVTDLRVLDVNGDGLVDVVHTAGTRLKTYFSLGRLPKGDGQFGQGSWTGPESAQLSTEPVAHCAPWSGLPVRFSDPDVRLADMNGDGLADIVRVRKGDIRYWPGRGNGLFGTGNLDDCPADTFSQDRSLVMAQSPQYADPDGTGLRLDDVNGDGLDDLVQVRFDAVDIWLNVDGTGWTKDRYILTNTPKSPAFQNRTRLVDMNGSGTRDILWGDGLNYRYIDLTGGVRPWVLKKVSNGLGKTTELEYSTSTRLMLEAQKAGTPWTKWTPMPVHVVTRSIEKDNLELAGRPTGVYVTEYQYKNPVYDGQQREFRGFEEATAKKLGDANSPTSLARSVFLLGECKDSNPNDNENPCALEERWRDNPREALKGLPVVSESFDEKGVYLSTAHHTYGLRKLYAGRDGRNVVQAYEKGSDSYLYDTGAFVPATSEVDLAEVVEETVSGSTTTNGNTDSRKVTLRAVQGRAHLKGSVEVDRFGNRTKAIAQGCVDGCVMGTDEEIHSFTAPGRPEGDTTGWLWRTLEAWAQGQGGAGEKRHQSATTYDEKGRPVSTGFYLSGSLPLDRHHSGNAGASGSGGSAGSGGGAGSGGSGGYGVAPAPEGASQDTGPTPREASRSTYNEFGQVVSSKGIQHRCRSVSYTEDFSDLPLEETIFAGLPTSTEDPWSCGEVELTSKVEAYDRGLGAVLRVRALHGEQTRAEYDQFGRIRRLFAPIPSPSGAGGGGSSGSGGAGEEGGSSGTPTICPANGVASVEVEYFLTTNPNEEPVSWMHTRTQDAADASVASYIEAWAAVDGMGRTIVTLAEADPDPEFGDGHPWIVNGLTDYDAKGAARKAYLAWFWDGNEPKQFPLSYQPSTPYGRQRYDAFGRQVQTFGLDGTITLQTKHHALSTDAWDAADLGPGPHQGTYASAVKDGHGRAIDTIERIHVGQVIEERHTLPSYLPTGEVAKITRHRGPLTQTLPGGDVVRWMRYDSLGRMVLNVEPNTTVGFSPDPSTSADAMKAWRYAYDDAGELVGTSDARGCGANYHYDSAGRLVAEDYSPCLPHHAPYSAPNLVTGEGTEVFTRYDNYNATDQADVATVASEHSDFDGSPAFLLGRVASVSDRGARVLNQVDCRGRVTAVAKRIVKPGTPSDDLAQRYAPRWYVQKATYDGSDRIVAQTTGVRSTELMGSGNKSEISLSYTANGKVKQVGGSYGVLVHHARHDADGRTLEIEYGDLAHTKTGFLYDERRRVKTVQTYRGPPSCWTAAPGSVPSECQGYNPSAQYGSSTPSTFPLLLEDTEFTYDSVDNPVEIRDWRLPHEWPAGAKPVSRKAEYDDLYRLTRLDYQYSSGDDEWVSPFAAEVGTHPEAWGAPPPNGDLADPRRAQPSPHLSFSKRVQQQTYNYDWLGNTTASDDDAHGFYDRSLGTIENGGNGAGPYQLTGASNISGETATPRRGNLSTKYDEAGNLVDLAVHRATPNAECLPSGSPCNQRFLYDWDETGRLSRARRWDTTSTGAAGDAEPSGAAAVELRYSYDGGDQRVLKTAVDDDGDQRHTAYVVASLELRRAAWDEQEGDYALNPLTEVGYLLATGVRLGRLHFDEKGVPTIGAETQGKLHVLLELADHLGSGSTVLDKTTGELAEKMTYQGYGSTESDYRPGRWGAVREDYRFTGKEEDSEIGLTYFGFRWLGTALGRWISCDPLNVHLSKADFNCYSYVSGQLLSMVDSFGLEPITPEAVRNGYNAIKNATMNGSTIPLPFVMGTPDAKTISSRFGAFIRELGGGDLQKGSKIAEETFGVKYRAIINEIINGRSDIKNISKALGALNSANSGKFNPQKPKSTSYNLRFEAHVGMDCAGAARMVLLQTQKAAEGALGLAKPLLEDMSPARLQKNKYFSSVDMFNASDWRTGDIVHLKDHNPNAVGHVMMVVERSTNAIANMLMMVDTDKDSILATKLISAGFANRSDAISSVELAASWGSLENETLSGNKQRGGVEFRTWYHNESTGKWGHFDNAGNFQIASELPYEEHSIDGAFRLKNQ